MPYPLGPVESQAPKGTPQPCATGRAANLGGPGPIQTGMSASPVSTPATDDERREMTTKRPNIVLIITDQQRFDTVAALGYPHMITPNLDRLVREGVAFTRTYVTAPSCAPSRASLFTGRYPHMTGVLRNDEAWPGSWVGLLARAGYRCVNVGKMHTFPYETPLGFHERHVVENKDRANPHLPFFLDNWDKALWARGLEKPSRVTYRRRLDYRERMGAFEWELPEDLHADNFVGNLARWWLERYPGREPFFLQVGFPGPHPPYDPPRRHLEAYRDRDIPMPTRAAVDLEAQPGPLRELREHHCSTDHDGIVHLASPSDEQLRRQRAHYYANITLIDEQVGAILRALEERGVLEETVIVFSSDHGDCLNDHGHIQKWTMYDPSVRVPAIVWGPRHVSAGVRVEGLVSMMDLGPTVLELAGVEPPETMQARSLVPALSDRPFAGREHVFSEHARDAILTGTDMMTMVRSQRWKLVCFAGSEEGQLFELAVDPQEEHDLWSDPGCAQTKKELLGTVERWRTESPDPTIATGSPSASALRS